MVVTLRSSPAVFSFRLTSPGGRFDRLRRRSRQAREQRPGRGDGQPRVAVIMSRFPKLSETFVLNEMIELERQGVNVEAFPLLRERQEVSHPEADIWVRRAHFQPFVSLAILRANLGFLAREPFRYLRVLAEVLSGTAGSANFFVGAIGILPKSVWFAQEMRVQRITHVHAHFATHPAVAALIVHRLTGIPFSFTAHGSDLHVDRRMLAAKLAAAAFGVTVSEFNREVIISECGDWARPKVNVIHCGVDTAFFAPAGRKPDPGAFSIVCVASLEEVKGHRFLIEACAKLRTAGIDFKCALVGDGPLRTEIETHIRAAGIEDRVTLYGGRTRDEVCAILLDSDVAILTSHPTAEGKREGIPVALMEAMSCGLPVIASDLSGIPELVLDGVTGILVSPGDVDAIAAALTRLSRDRLLRERLGAAGRDRVIQQFAMTRTTARLASLLTGGTAPVGAEAGFDASPLASDRDRLPRLVTAEPV
jgi:colanic acid/amylovoran biosynthesis glycosyltransferase